jgi:small redox-active disulfide protein 2
MKTISVLGSGCAKCTKTAALIEETAKAMGCEVEVVKQTDPEVIMGFGVMSTPAVVVDGQVVHSGSMPLRAQIEQWLGG